MNPAVNMLLILVGSPIVLFLTHVVWARLSRKLSPQVVALQACLLGIVPIALLLWLYVFRALPIDGLFTPACYSAIVYLLLANTYFHFFNMSETARRIRILYEIYKAGTLPSDEMTALYKSADIISTRLQRLVAMKQLACTNGYYRIDGRILYWAGMIIVAVRGLLGLREEEE